MKLVLFIHGLGGSADSTWKKFPEVIRADAGLSGLYDVKAVDYSSGAFGSKPSLPTCAAILKTEIENRYSAYSDIALIAHSQGGLVARYYIAERLNSAQPLPVTRLLTFATPHQGSGLATPLKWLPFTSQQSEDLDPNSQFLQALAVAWGQAKPDRRVLTKYVVAAGDAIVGQVSAMGSWSPGYEVVSGVGHLAVVKPETADDTSFRIARKFLLEDGVQPGGVEADFRQPLLRLKHVDSVPSTRFIYSARVLPFIGRDAKINVLAEFLGGPEQPFRWMVMHGSGGVGKNRLALELCLAVGNEWHAGFLPQDGQEPDWGRWQPLMPTLIVIDHAARDTERTGRLLQALAGRGPADGTARLAAPVRVLLVERTGTGDWLDKIVGVGTTEAQVNAAHASADLPLATIDDLWPIFECVLKEKSEPLPDKTETLAALDEIDPERRPLYAHFMADAIARGDDIRHFDAALLRAQVIKVDRVNYWNPAGAKPEDERLLAIATMAGRLPVSALDDVTEKILPKWDIDRHPAIFRAMTGRASGENIEPYEPDIVGEHFALGCLADENLSDANRARLCELAWRLDPLSMAQFMLRAHHDLPDHAMLRWVRKLPPSEGRPREFWSVAAVDLMTDLQSRDPDAARALLDDMRRVAASPDAALVWGGGSWTNAALWEQWARAAFNLMTDLQSRDPDAARALLDEMRGVAETHDEAPHWKQFADALGLDLGQTARDKTPLWEQWAKAAVNLTIGLLTNDSGSRDTDAARALLDHMRDVAEARDKALLWEMWAMAAVNLTHDLQARDPVAARALLDDMRGVATARDEAPLWEQWAKAVHNLAKVLVLRDPVAARALLDGMRSVAAARDEAPLWELWARAAGSMAIVHLTNDLGSRDSVAARALLNDMRTVAAERNEASLWEMWAEAAGNVTNDLGSRDPVAARALLNDLRGVAAALDEASLWEQWAVAAAISLDDLRSRDPVAAGALLEDIRGVAGARDERALWKVWTVAAAISLNDLRSRDLVAARALLDDMRDVVAALDEAALWEQWAKVSYNLIVDLGSRDPAALRALVDDMLKAVERHPGEFGGWQTKVVHLVMQAAVNVTRDLASRDPVAARVFCAEVLGLPEWMLQSMRFGD